MVENRFEHESSIPSHFSPIFHVSLPLLFSSSLSLSYAHDSRIFDAFPEQIKKWKQDSNFAQEKGIDWKKLESSLKEIKLNLTHIDYKMMKLKEVIAKPKKPASIDANRQVKSSLKDLEHLIVSCIL